ncbi:MAG: acyltransferase family protein [Pyrinomonadaceae bacterium]
MNPRLSRNNFDLLRTIFAGVVCLVHSYELSGYESLAPVTQVLSSATAVKSFFVVSGFLIFMSYERSTSVSSYAGKRFRRVYPAYFTVVMLCSLFLAAVSSKAIGEYFSLAWLKYIASNLAFLNFLQPTLPGVFEGNKFAFVNGPLWTLKIEVMFYILVPVFVFLVRKFKPLRVLAFFYLCSVAYAFIFARMAANTGSLIYLEIGRQLPGQLSYFMAGAFFYYFLDGFDLYVVYFLL